MCKYNDLKILDLYNQGKTDKEIALALNYKLNNFARYRKRHLKLNPNKPKETYTLNSTELSILIGTILGDSCIRYVHQYCKYPNLTFTHCIKLKEWFLWKAIQLNNLCASYNEYKYLREKRPNILSPDSTFLLFTGKNLKCLTSIYNEFYINNCKLLPINFLAYNLTDLSIYVWYMDDGCYDKKTNSYLISTDCFNKDQLKQFCDLLKSKFNLNFSIKKDNSLYLKHSSNNIFTKLLLKYNSCTSMNYKIGMFSLNSVKRGKTFNKLISC